MPRLGLRRSFLLSNAIMVAGALLLALAPNVATLLGGRLVIGVAGGLTTVLTPMYLAAIAPYGTLTAIIACGWVVPMHVCPLTPLHACIVAYKGAVGTMTQLGVTSGLFLSQILSLSSIWGTPTHWRLLLGVPLVFAAIQVRQQG